LLKQDEVKTRGTEMMLRFFSIVLACLILWTNFLVAQPAFADRPKLDRNLDYLELTETLDGLLQSRTNQELPEGISSTEQLQQKIAELQYQKYVVEMGEGYGECQNNTSQPIVVYGPKSKKSTATYDNERYLLAAGETTDEDWDCDGVYLPNDAKVAGLDLGAAGAVKILDGTRFVISEDPNTQAIDFNLPPAQVFKSGDINWDIPDVASSAIAQPLLQAPTD
jgi:hypothetical protein